MSKETNTWYDKVYLCYERYPNGKHIDGFACYKYDSINNADKAVLKDISLGLITKETRIAMIPVCRWVPRCFVPFVLNWKLKKIYWKGNHIIFNVDDF